MDYWLPIIVLFGAFFFMLALGVPIVYAIGLSTLASIFHTTRFQLSISVVSQKLASGLDSFTLLAIPFFILSGNIMNHGGIARRLINFARILGGRLPGSLAHCNILGQYAVRGNFWFSRGFRRLRWAASCIRNRLKRATTRHSVLRLTLPTAPTGLLIPPSKYVNRLFTGQWWYLRLPHCSWRVMFRDLLGLALMVIAGIIAVRRGYPKPERPTLRQAGVAIWMAIPSIFLIVLIMGGVLSGIFTPTEASAIAVIYTLFLALVLYREISVKDLPKIFWNPLLPLQLSCY